MINPLSELLSPGHYFPNPYSIPPAIMATMVWALGLFIFDLSKKSNLHRPFLYLCLSVAIWLYGNAFLFSSSDPTVALFWIHIVYIGFIMIPVTVFHIAVVYTNRWKMEKNFVIVTYAAGVILMALTWHEGFFKGVRQHFWGYYPTAGELLPVFLVFFLFFPLAGLQRLVAHLRNCRDPLERKRTKYLLIAFVFALLSYIDIFPIYGVEIYPLGYLAIFCFILSLTYSIIRYHNLIVEQHSEELEHQIEEKTKELSQVLQQLRTTQIRLYETGKVSALASLSAGILHQISQPVTAIHGLVKFIKKEMNPAEPFYKGIVLMDEQSQYLKEMLEDLMDLVRHREIKKENISVNDCIKRATNLMTDELRIRRIEWDTVLAENLPIVYADPIHLQQIFMNIIVNGMEALVSLPKGSRRCLNIISQFESMENKVILRFEDNGPGISDDIKGEIFEPFFSTKTKGSGIGLALCKDLIAEHNGQIEIKNNPTGGAVFVIKLPAAAAG